ncbi:unnamed protein product [Spirodela intermedia]|uniref:Uncharacterized protein n=1 Tax=Spirodela intermedia TaxID=51605 RepID=A0A7I8IFU3_SPIIN|nr:unnamed protein product [Spirodela intermedia]CAA6655742.1 unnamed protein product [Spirodela intermedia]
MALANPALCPPRPCGFCGKRDPEGRRRAFAFVTSAASLLCAGNGRADGYSKRVSEGGLPRAVAVRGRLELSNSPVVENGQARASVEIPVTCYQIIGVSEKAEKDEVVKTVMELKGSEIEDGYTMDVIHSRQDLLTDVRDKLLFEPEYAGSIKEKVPPKASLRIPWGGFLLLYVGEDKLVLEIGRVALQHQGSKLYVHDLLLSMALAECSIAKIAFETNKVSQGFEALARSQYLLRSKSSLEKLPLLSQIEESLEELAPACTLELLSMPQTPENGERRRGAIAALQELLRQGLEVETSCRVQDWPCFLLQALNRLMAAEIVDLLPWDVLATTRKNKKSLESQNQRIIIDFNCFYVVMIAHVALGFSTRQKDLIGKAMKICECLVASEGTDLKFEEAFCSLLLGQGIETAAVEELHQLQSNGSSVSRNVEVKSSSKETNGKTGINQSVEIWLKDSVLSVFPDTRDCPPSLVSEFFWAQKRILGGINYHKGTAKPNPDMSHRSSPYFSLNKKSLEDTTQLNSTRQMGEAVKQLAPSNIGKQLTDDNSGYSTDNQSVQRKSSLGVRHRRTLEGWWGREKTPGAIACVAVLGCIVFSAPPTILNDTCATGKASMSSRLVGDTDPKIRPDNGVRGNLAQKLGELLKMSQQQLHPTDVGIVENSWSPDIHFNLPTASAAVGGMIHRRQMPLEEAEALLRKWQAIKAEALGSCHQVEILSDILAEAMLSQWKGLANSAKARSCFWRFVLLQLSILRAEILSDGVGGEVAEIEAALEEAAELVDAAQPKSSNYYSSYKILYILKKNHDGSWRFCEGSIQRESPSL